MNFDAEEFLGVRLNPELPRTCVEEGAELPCGFASPPLGRTTSPRRAPCSGRKRPPLFCVWGSEPLSNADAAMS
eukprot:10808727-Alexandrium_andersonii.AAC.1